MKMYEKFMKKFKEGTSFYIVLAKELDLGDDEHLIEVIGDWGNEQDNRENGYYKVEMYDEGLEVIEMSWLSHSNKWSDITMFIPFESIKMIQEI